VTLALTLLVRDEADVIEANLRHHLAQGVDVVLVCDHGSRDATPQILERFAREGHVHVTRREDERFLQHEWVTELARAAATDHGADWVINGDADEFWMPAAGTLGDLFAALPAAVGQVAAPRNDIVAPGVREARSAGPLGFGLLPKVAHRALADIVVRRGNHGVDNEGLELLPPVGLVDVVHWPLRSFEQFERKVRNMGEAFAATPGVPADESADQRMLFDRLRAGTLREWFDERQVSDAQVRDGIEAGRLVRDGRLERALAGEPVAAGAAGAARALVAERVGPLLEWLEGRLAAEREPIERRVGDLDDALTEARVRIEELARERDGFDVSGSEARAALAEERRRHELLRNTRAARAAQALARLRARLRR
jgi:Glycosyl transferase family 2